MEEHFRRRELEMVDILSADDFVFRQVADADLAQLVDWIRNDPELEFFDRVDTVESLRTFFADRDREICCVVEHLGLPLGYVEFYPSRLWFHVHGEVADERPWGMDVFIGNPSYRNQGLGARMVTLAARHILGERGATRVVIDPEASNGQAIRCYEKAGFRRTQLIPGTVTDEGEFADTWLMEFIAPV